MWNKFGISIANVQLQQSRLGHRLRGLSPLYARSLKERLEELNRKDELYTAKTDIGLPYFRKARSEMRAERMQHMKKMKADTNLEKATRNLKLFVDTDEVRREWLKTTAPFHKKTIAEHYGIFEHLYQEGYFVPFVNMEVLYEVDDLYMPVYYGNVIKPREAKFVPTVKFESNENDMWTLAFTSLDGHLTEANKEYVHWFVSNIPGNHVEKGDTLVEYLQPFPPKGTGFHRYVYVLYKQNKMIDYDIEKVTSTSPLEKRTFVTRDWYQKHEDDITPAGLAFFQSDWDSSLKEFFHNTLKMKEPIYEYDFPQPYIKPQEWFPRRVPFNLYMDKYRDPKQINKEYLLRKLKTEDPFKAPEPPLKYPNAHAFPKTMPSWLKLHEKKIRLGWGRVNDV